MRYEGILIVAMAGSLAVVGCTSKEASPAKEEPAAAAPAPKADPTPSEPVAAAADPAAEAKSIFEARCVTCHGANGKGDGAASASLNPKPRDYSSAEWQASVTDEHIAKIIIGGGPAVGLSALMPPNPDLANKPEVVEALVLVVRNLGAQ